MFYFFMAPKTKEAAKGGDIGLSTNQADLAAQVLLIEEKLGNQIKSESARRRAEAEAEASRKKAEAARQADAVTRQKSLEKQLADAVQKLSAGPLKRRPQLRLCLPRMLPASAIWKRSRSAIRSCL